MTLRRYPGVTYDSSGMPLTGKDWNAQGHLDERDGIYCSRGCVICAWAKGWAEKQAQWRVQR